MAGLHHHKPTTSHLERNSAIFVHTREVKVSMVLLFY
jgi:hypothetical protein